MTATLTVSSEAALAAATVLADALPTTSRLTARLSDSASPSDVDPALAAGAVVGTFVGSRSFDVALALRPGLVPSDAAGGMPLEQLVQTALTDASSRFGEGVLGELRIDDAAALFADPVSTVVELRVGEALVGLFAARTRSAGFRPASDGIVGGRLNRINNVEMVLTVQIGKTRMAVRDVLGLEAGAIVELDRSAGAPADILLNGRLIAHGEVVVVDQDYAVRITNILDASEPTA